MFKNWIRNIFNLGVEVSDDVNIDIAMANYQKYQEDLKVRQKAYIKTLCNKIKIASRDGFKFIDTLELNSESFMTQPFLMEIKEYFEQRGFKVEKLCTIYHLPTLLRIHWDEGDK